MVCYLGITIWDFSAVSGKLNRFYLNQLELTLVDFEVLLSAGSEGVQNMDLFSQ